MSTTEAISAHEVPEQHNSTNVLGSEAVAAQVELLMVPETVFTYQTSQDLLKTLLSTCSENNIACETATFADQPMFAKTAHALLNSYYFARFNYEVNNGIKEAIAPPLPKHWVDARLDDYSKGVHKGSSDKAHQRLIANSRADHLPKAVQYIVKLPEIGTAQEIQTLLTERGFDIAADAITDLLVVYGFTLKNIETRATQQRKQDEAVAARIPTPLRKI